MKYPVEYYSNEEVLTAAIQLYHLFLMWYRSGQVTKEFFQKIGNMKVIEFVDEFLNIEED